MSNNATQSQTSHPRITHCQSHHSYKSSSEILADEYNPLSDLLPLLPWQKKRRFRSFSSSQPIHDLRLRLPQLTVRHSARFVFSMPLSAMNPSIGIGVTVIRLYPAFSRYYRAHTALQTLSFLFPQNLSRPNFPQRLAPLTTSRAEHRICHLSHYVEPAYYSPPVCRLASAISLFSLLFNITLSFLPLYRLYYSSLISSILYL